MILCLPKRKIFRERHGLIIISLKIPTLLYSKVISQSNLYETYDTFRKIFILINDNFNWLYNSKLYKGFTKKKKLKIIIIIMVKCANGSY